MLHTPLNSAKPDGRERNSVRPNATSEQDVKLVGEFIQRLPAVPSNYCRNKTTRLYLPEDLRNVTYLYTIYSRAINEEGNIPVSERVFRDIFNSKFNLGFHRPKKDKCQKWIAFTNKTEIIQEEKVEYIKHIEEIEATNARFKNSKV